MTDLLSGLNNKQQEAVQATEGYVRVIAGAGSGKTKALTRRYAYIVNELGISPANILCVTFTNKAANEMKRRVKQLIGPDQDPSFLTTYHGFAVKFLREEISKLGFPSNFIIMDGEDQKTILKDIYQELELTSKVITYKQSIAYIRKIKNLGGYTDLFWDSEKIADKATKKKPEEQVFDKYIEKQLRNYALDFDDLILLTLDILLKYDEVLEKWQERMHYIQIDETQDTSKNQFLLVQLLSGKHNNLFAVGDPDQTIYEWRGADPTYLVDFDQYFQGAETIIMDQNYRSTPNILSISNDIIANNKIRVKKSMFTENPQGNRAVVYHAKNEIEEAKWLVKKIKEIKKEHKAKNRDFAILYRASYLSRNIEQALIKAKIGYVVFGGIRFFERKEIKDILCFLRLIHNPNDDISFLRVINVPARGLGKKFIETLKGLSVEHNDSLYNTLKGNIGHSALNRAGAKEFISKVESLKKDIDQMQLSDYIQKVMEEMGLTELYRKEGDEERLENVLELQNSIILQEQEYDERIQLEQYLQEIALYTDMDLEDERDLVRLMTIHTSKGLEFPNVFVIGFNDGIIPSARSIKDRGRRALEEERRLAYVAMTRAEDRLFITEPEGLNFSTGEEKSPSRFLSEVNIASIDEEGQKRDLSAQAVHSDDDYNSAIFSVGDIVNHKVWGEGTVTEYIKEKGQYTVHFKEKDQTKPILDTFKGLTLIKQAETSEGNIGIQEASSDHGSGRTQSDPTGEEKEKEGKISKFLKNLFK